MIQIKDFIKFGATKMVLSFLFLMILAVPYWKLIGLL